MHLLSHVKCYVQSQTPSSLMTFVATVLSLLTVSDSELLRCTINEDCPRGGFCFRDECARCLCPEGFHAINLYSQSKLTKICQKRPEVSRSLVFEHCNKKPGSRACPYGSHCDDVTSRCVCNRGLRPHHNNSQCRLGVYNEPCSRKRKCDSNLGLQCKGQPAVCKCKSSHHRPSKWTKYVLRRWDYSMVEGEPQECVARAVGEPCRSDAECGAVRGSGAICGLCGFCECRVPGHVPDVLGTRCGPGMGNGQPCSMNSRFVCDGSRGLACGDVCDIYAFDFRTKVCHCSQMHDRMGGGCVTKQVGSPCSTDLDCYPVREGFGYCENGRCRDDIPASGADYQPYLSSRTCSIKRPLSTMPPGGGRRKHKDRHRNSTRSQSLDKPMHTGKYAHDGDSKLLALNFDNITDIFSFEVTTPQQNTERFNSVRQVSSSSDGCGRIVPLRLDLVLLILFSSTWLSVR